MNGSQLIEAKNGAREIDDTEIDYWLRRFKEEREQRAWEDRLEDDYLDFLAEQERQYVEDCRVDYGGI